MVARGRLRVAGTARELRLGIGVVLGRVLGTITTRAQKASIGGCAFDLGIVVVAQVVAAVDRGRGAVVVVDEVNLVVVVGGLEADDPTRAP